MAYFEEADNTAELVVDATELVVDAAELVVDATELVVDAAELVVDAAEALEDLELVLLELVLLELVLLELVLLELVAEELIVDSTEGIEDTSDMIEDSTELISETTDATDEISEEASDEDLGLLQPANPIAARTMTAKIARNFFMVLFLSVCEMNSLLLFIKHCIIFNDAAFKKATADSVHLLEKNAIVFSKNSQNDHIRIIENQSLLYDIMLYCSKCRSSYMVWNYGM